MVAANQGIRAGIVTGGLPLEAGVAVAGGRIVAVGKGSVIGNEEIDSRRLLVTPGFVDTNTNHDGRACRPERFPAAWYAGRKPRRCTD